MTKRNVISSAGFGLLVLASFIYFWPSRPGASETIQPRADVMAWINTYFGQDQRKVVAMTRLAESQQFKLFYPTSRSMEIERQETLAMACFLLG